MHDNPYRWNGWKCSLNFQLWNLSDHTFIDFISVNVYLLIESFDWQYINFKFCDTNYNFYQLFTTFINLQLRLHLLFEFANIKKNKNW